MAYNADRVAMRTSLSKLQTLYLKTSPNPSKAVLTGNPSYGATTLTNDSINGDREEVERDKLRSMKPYQRAEYTCATQMRELRIQIAMIDQMQASKPKDQSNFTQQEINRAKQNVRKLMKGLQKSQADLQREAAREGREAEAKDCLRHIEKTKSAYRSVLGIVSAAGGGDEEAFLRATGTSVSQRHQRLSGLADLDKDGGVTDGVGPSGDMISLRDDTEFAQFFQQVTDNDIKIDQALDRISAGIQRLDQQARGISDELAVQNTLLDETEEKVDRVDAKLQGLNKRLEKTIKEVDKDKMCIYVFCFLVILGLAGGVYAIISGHNKK